MSIPQRMTLTHTPFSLVMKRLLNGFVEPIHPMYGKHPSMIEAKGSTSVRFVTATKLPPQKGLIHSQTYIQTCYHIGPQIILVPLVKFDLTYVTGSSGYVLSVTGNTLNSFQISSLIQMIAPTVTIENRCQDTIHLLFVIQNYSMNGIMSLTMSLLIQIRFSQLRHSKFGGPVITTIPINILKEYVTE